MKIAVVGLGSMGKRRIRLMKEMYPENTIIGIDARIDRRQEAAELFQIESFEGLADLDGKPDCVFVCTSPLSHNAIIHEALDMGCNVFTELNLVKDGYEENMRLAKEKGVTLFLSSTFYYREEIRYIREQISSNKKWNYIYHIGQYLPDWHPWESYKDFFLGYKRTNGCREIMAIELPWLTGTFGDVTDVKVMSDKQTELNIDYKDNFMIQLQHKGGNKGSLIVDVVSPCAVRNLEVYTENGYLSWNGTPESLKEYDAKIKELKKVALNEATEHIDGYSAFIIENAYKNEIMEFFEVVAGLKEPFYGFEQDLKILELIDKIGA